MLFVLFGAFQSVIFALDAVFGHSGWRLSLFFDQFRHFILFFQIDAYYYKKKNNGGKPVIAHPAHFINTGNLSKVGSDSV